MDKINCRINFNVMGMNLADYARQRYKGKTVVSKNYLCKLNKIVKLVGRCQTVLDLGCGDGELVEELKARGNFNFAMGVDLDKGDFQVDLQHQALPFRNNYFEVITAIELIEHIWDVDRLLQDIKRVLTKDGKLIISTPNLCSLGRRLMMLIGRNPYVENFLYPTDAGHVKHYTIKDFKYLLLKNGFIIEKIVGDCVMVNKRLFSSKLGDWLPSLSRSMIVVCRPIKY